MKAVQARTRITVRNILFATDFSPAANAAAPIAIEIAQRYGAKVYGVHVNRFDDYTGAAPDAWAAMAEAAEKETKEDAGRLNEQLQCIEHEVVMGEGNIWEVVSGLIKEKEIDLVLLHVIEDPKAGDLVDRPEVVDLKERKLQQLVTEHAGLWCEPTYIVEQEPAAEKILDVAKRRHTDLIVMGARPAKGLATHLNIETVHNVVSQATCPVLTVRG